MLDLLPGDAPLSVERTTFPQLVQRGALYAQPTEDYWLDAGRPETYRRGNLDLINGSRRDRDDAVHATAQVDAEARIVNSVIGAGARVAAGAQVNDSVIFPGASVGRNARVSAACVMGHVADEAVVHDSLVAG